MKEHATAVWLAQASKSHDGRHRRERPLPAFSTFVEGHGSNALKGETMVEKALPHVVIVGGGFGGLAAARTLRHAPVRVTVIDRSNHHLFQPLLYQVATATLAPGDIAAPIRHLLRRQRNVTVAMAEVTGVDAANRRVLVN